MKDQHGKFSVDGVLALVLFGIFSLCVLAVLLLGARSYRRLTERGQDSYERRTAAQYIVTRVRQADTRGALSVESGNVMELTEVIDGMRYVTYVYCHEGYLHELFAPEGLAFRPDAGEPILPARAVSFTLEDDLLTAVITDSSGRPIEICVILRSYGGGL